MLSLCHFVTVAVAAISQGMFQVVAGDRVHSAVRDSSGAFVGTSLGAARCLRLWRLLFVPREVARSLGKGVGDMVFGRSCLYQTCNRSATHNSKQTTNYF